MLGFVFNDILQFCFELPELDVIGDLYAEDGTTEDQQRQLV